jgi:hypothetical protein
VLLTEKIVYNYYKHIGMSNYKICHTGYADCLLASSQHNLYNIYPLLCIQCLTPDDGQKTCPKHVDFYSKNKFQKFAYLVGFIIRNSNLMDIDVWTTMKLQPGKHIKYQKHNLHFTK